MTLELPWVECPTFDVDCELKVERRYLDIPAEFLNRGKTLLQAMLAEMPGGAEQLADLVQERTEGRFYDELLALASVIDADWRQLMLANISYDMVLSSFGCSTVALPTPTGPVLARNMDWWPERVLAQSSSLVRYMQGTGLCFANAGWPGAIGVVSGLSGNGFAIVLNAVCDEERGNFDGYPVMLHIRRVLEDARDFDEALTLLTETPLAAPALLTLVGSENAQRVVIERTPTRHALRWANDEALIATNDYRLLRKPQTHQSQEIYRTTCSRFDFLTESLSDRSTSRETTDAELLYLLTDSSVIQGITAQHIVMRPATGDVRLFVPRSLLNPG